MGTASQEDEPRSPSKDLALVEHYLVGLFDGEGCITTAVSKRGIPYVHVQVVITTPEIPCLFQEHWGGSVSARKLTGRNRQMHVWRVTGSKARPSLESVSKYGRIKNRQAELALSLIDLSRPSGGRGSYVVPPDEREERMSISNQIRSLNGARARFVKPGTRGEEDA